MRARTRPHTRTHARRHAGMRAGRKARTAGTHARTHGTHTRHARTHSTHGTHATHAPHMGRGEPRGGGVCVRGAGHAGMGWGVRAWSVGRAGAGAECVPGAPPPARLFVRPPAPPAPAVTLSACLKPRHAFSKQCRPWMLFGPTLDLCEDSLALVVKCRLTECWLLSTWHCAHTWALWVCKISAVRRKCCFVQEVRFLISRLLRSVSEKASGKSAFLPRKSSVEKRFYQHKPTFS